MTGPKKEHAFLGFAGCVDAHRQRDGHLIAIFASVASGIESDPELPWSVSCEDHNTCVCTPTLDAARRCKTDDFCDDCRDKQPATAELSSLAQQFKVIEETAKEKRVPLKLLLKKLSQIAKSKEAGHAAGR